MTHIEGAPDQDHYAIFDIGPQDAINCWSPTWDPRAASDLGEILRSIARIGTKGNPLRDAQKIRFYAGQLAERIEALGWESLSGKLACPPAPDTEVNRTATSVQTGNFAVTSDWTAVPCTSSRPCRGCHKCKGRY